ncbi:MAG: hypothetical protein M3Y39_13165 [Chloroflexota bacterium]|nr:hypothetical protein [Chloroflexota bacterium]
MAIQCQYCGTDLPRDDARFCNNCGMLVPSHPFSPQSISAAKINASQSPAPAQARDEGKPVLREQVAHLPPARPSALPARNAPSSWHGQYTLSEQDEQEKKGPSDTALAEPQEKLPETPQPEMDDEEDVAEEPAQPEQPPSPAPQPRPLPNVARVRDGARDRSPQRKSAAPSPRTPVWPTAMTHVSVNEPAEGKALPEQQTPPIAPAPGRELHVRVWEPEVEESSESEHADENRQDVEDLPTRAIAAVPAERANAQEQSVELLPTSPLDLSHREPAQARPEEEPPTSPLPQQSSEPTDSSPYDIENQSTTALPPSKGAPSQAGNTILEAPTQNVNIDTRRSSRPGNTPSQAGNTMLEAPTQNVYIDKRQPEAVQRVPAPHTPPPVQEPAAGVAQDNRGQAPVRPQKRSRLPLLVGALLLVILILAGIGAWIAAAQPFSVAPITQPQLSFSNAQLGIALSYPNGWTQQVTPGAPGAAHFFASNHTAGVDIIVADAGDVNAALQQQATKLGLSGTKAGAALSFAGTTWQQSQGNLQQSGANYTVTLLAAVHGSHLYTIVQQAPQSNYADWEQTFFSPLRSSLKFL